MTTNNTNNDNGNNNDKSSSLLLTQLRQERDTFQHKFITEHHNNTVLKSNNKVLHSDNDRLMRELESVQKKIMFNSAQAIKNNNTNSNNNIDSKSKSTSRRKSSTISRSSNNNSSAATTTNDSDSNRTTKFYLSSLQKQIMLQHSIYMHQELKLRALEKQVSESNIRNNKKAKGDDDSDIDNNNNNNDNSDIDYKSHILNDVTVGEFEDKNGDTACTNKDRGDKDKNLLHSFQSFYLSAQNSVSELGRLCEQGQQIVNGDESRKLELDSDYNINNNTKTNDNIDDNIIKQQQRQLISCEDVALLTETLESNVVSLQKLMSRYIMKKNVSEDIDESCKLQ